MAQFSRYYTYIEPAFKTPKTRAYTMLVLSLFAIAFFGFFAIRPTIVTILSLQKEIGQAQEIDDKLAQKLAALNRAQEVLDANQSRAGLLQQAVPNAPNVADILRALESRAEASGVTLGTVQVRTINLTGAESMAVGTAAATMSGIQQPTQEQLASAGATPLGIKLSFAVIGGEGNIRSFLASLENVRRILTIDSIRMTTDEKSGGVIADIAIQGYYLE